MLNHKKTAAFLMSIIICASTPIYSALADEAETTTVSETADTEPEYIESGEFTYTVNSDNTACIENCTSNEKNLVIPDTIDGLTVTELGKYALGENEKYFFETITIPASVNYISANNPFSVCSNLKEIKVDSGNKEYFDENGVLYSKDKTKLLCYPPKKSGSSFTIPEGVKSIGSSALYNTQLTEIKFPSTLEEINSFSLSSCSKLSSVDLSNTNLTYIDSYGFAFCDILNDVKLPDTLSAIGGAAFAKDISLKEITLPEKLESVAQYAFVGTGLKSIYIPPSVTDIGYCAFGYDIDDNNNENMISDFIIIGYTGSAAYTYAHDTDSEYDYNNNFTFRTPEEHEDLQYLEGLTIHTLNDLLYAEVDSGIAIIGCFSNDKTFTVPSEIDGISVTEIYPSAFSECTSEEIILPEGIKTLKKMAFMNCTNLKSITLPQSITSIEDNAFDGCTSLETADLGGAVSISSNIFDSCTALREVNLSGDCTGLINGDDNPFLYLSALEKINVSDGNGDYSSKDGVLYNKDKTVLIYYPLGRTNKEFTVPDGIKELAENAFISNPYIKKVDLSHVEIIGISAFEQCTNLSEIKLSKNLKKIDAGAFYGCLSLKEVRLYTSDTEIKDFSLGYYYNESLTKEDGSLGGSDIIEGFKLYTKKSKNDTGVEYAEKNNIETVTNTVEIFGKNVKAQILWICGGGIGLLLAALIGSHAMKKSRQKESSSQSKKKKEDKPEKNKNENEKGTE